MLFVVGIFNLIVTMAAIFSMAALFFRGREELSVKMCIACQGMVAVWCSSQLLIAMSDNDIQFVASYVYGSLGICFIGVFWLWFAILYCGKTISRRVFAATFILPAIHFVAVVTNPLHHLYHKSISFEQVENGILFYTNFISIYIYAVIGAVLLFRGVTIKGVRKEESKNNQNKAHLLVVLSVLAPTIISIYNILEGESIKSDTNSIGFAFSMIFVMMATFKYQFLDLKKQLVITNEKLLIETERNRIAQQVHDTVGHTLTMIQSYMKLAEISLKKDQSDEAGEYLSEARVLTGKGIKELRESINMLRQGENCELVTKSVMQLADQVKEMEVEVTVKGEDSDKYSHLSRVVYDTVRETITNAVKYSGADKMEIILKFKKNSLEIVIADNGKGCEKIEENNGISGIKERIKNAKGKVRFITSEGQGFLTRVELPVKQSKA